MNIFKNLAIIVLMITFLIILSIHVEATTGTINSETVNLREEANTTSSILEQLDIGDEVEVLEQADGWYKVIATVDGEEITGYISESLLDVEGNVDTTDNGEETPEENQPSGEPVNNEESTNNETPVNNETSTEVTAETPVTEEPTPENAVTIEENTSYELSQAIQIKILPLMNAVNKDTINGGIINVVEVINDWCRVENGTQDGWVRIYQLKNSITNTGVTSADTTETNTDTTSETEEPVATENPEDLPVIRTAYVNADSLNVRQEPNTSSEVIASLSRNDQVSIVEELDGWYRIRIEDQLGYISATYISDERSEETTSRGNISREETNTTATENAETTESIDTTPVASSGNGEAVVEYAKQYLGYKYVSGGSSPSTGFDCSGFTSYVYKNFGVTLSRTSRGQINNGVAVEKNNLLPGDLVVFNNDANTAIGHVGIYVGSGNFIHAANPSDGVKITSLSSSYYVTRYVGARRVM